MTLPPPRTAVTAIQTLADVLRQGVRYGRGRAARDRREACQRELRGSYEAAPPDEFVMPVYASSTSRKGKPGSRPVRFESLGKAQRNCNIVYPSEPASALPPSWTVRFFERVSWPPEMADERTPVFRFFLEVGRGSQRPVLLPVHDLSDQWVGPRFKSRWIHKLFPVNPHFPIRTWLVYGDRLSTRSMCQWLTLLLAQRTLLTPDEESAALEAFFRGGRDSWADKRIEAYAIAKRRFVHPIGGRPSFPTYLRQTARWLVAAERLAEEPGDAPGSLVALRTLRTREPQLHRAILDRIRSGKIETETYDGKQYVSAHDAEVVDAERLANASRRVATAHPAERQEWIRRLVARRLSRASAVRKLKRWMNVEKLSAEEIEASIRKGRLVRITSRRPR